MSRKIFFLPRGFLCSGVASGIKRKGQRDVALLVNAGRAPQSYALFTQNHLRAAPVILSEQRIGAGKVVAVVVNSGNANACTGRRGMQDAQTMTLLAAQSLGLGVNQVMVCSTGIIGTVLPMPQVKQGITAAAQNLSVAGLENFTAAISTTDAFLKVATVAGKIAGVPFRVTGVAKGAGMIHPNMATMLAFILTDLNLQRATLRPLLTECVRDSFNRITVDGDESTNDTIVLMASGEAGNSPLRRADNDYKGVVGAVSEVSLRLAKLIVKDGEGATKCLEINVLGARTSSDAEKFARRVANSPLVKTAFYGCDPNWGRIAAAVGAAGVPVDAQRIRIWIDSYLVFTHGQGTRHANSPALIAALKAPEISVKIAVGPGPGAATIYAADLTHDYVELNSAYHS